MNTWQVGSILDSTARVGCASGYTNLYRNGQIVWEITRGRTQRGFLRCEQVDRISRLIDCDRGAAGVWLIGQTEKHRTGIWYRVLPNVWQCLYVGLGFAEAEWVQRDAQAIAYFRQHRPNLQQLTQQLGHQLVYRHPTIADVMLNRLAEYVDY
jgi:hypothetical protein